MLKYNLIKLLSIKFYSSVFFLVLNRECPINEDYELMDINQGTNGSLTLINTAHKLSFEWAFFGISSTDSKVRTALYSIINRNTGT